MLSIFVALISCAPEPPPLPGLPVEAVTGYIREGVDDPGGWARDLIAALQSADLTVDAEHVCQVLAVVEQESGYSADPAVPGLARIARRQIVAELSLLGPLAELGTDWLLGPTAEGADASFEARLAEVRTERQLDELFRGLVLHHSRHAASLPFTAGLIEGQLEQLNPVRTSGSMQVSVSWAQAAGERDGIPAATVRDLLYTRAGGLRWGTARLFAHPASYDRPLYRFADYNAGLYASRNAALQEQLSQMMELPLRPDGDLMVHHGPGSTDDGETMGLLLAWRAMYAPELSERTLRRDVALEKEEGFEQTRTWNTLKATYRTRTGEEPAYARVPDVALDSPKLSSDRTTAWFAESVERRYRACLERG
ncbi:MAG TPA: DUF1615 family protein [Deltaproteobacteria bacterium]|nr:DUF1615 family protein [Deltaproteobacteria bacterium]